MPAFVLLHALCPARARNALLFFGSLGVYAIGAGVEAAAVLLGTAALNHLAARWMRRAPSMRRAALALGLGLDLGVLFFFKYLAAALALLGPARAGAPLPRAAMPLGVSFYVFQAAAYLIDVYRGATEAERSFVSFGAFLAAFPQLTMGPILRYGELREALRQRRPCRADVEQGFQLFAVGLSFKALIADRLAFLWVALERIGFDYISTPLAWLGAAGYSLQLYFDFQGYSLMAMGLGRMLALPVARNFDEPYLSRSVSEFYRRWHMTLGRWFRDYLYIPLGGSRNGTLRTLFSLAVVWLLTGLWHGPSLNYLLWGGVLFALIALEKLFLRRAFGSLRVLPHLYLPFVIAQTCSEAINRGDFVKYLSSCWQLFAAAVFLCLPWPRRWYERHRDSALVWIPLFALFWASVFFLSAGSGGAFLYFRF